MFLFKKKSIGIDIADHTIEAVELSGSGKDIDVAGIGRAKLGPGVVERGRIKDKAKLAAAVKQMFQEAKPRPLVVEKVILGLPESQAYIHTFTLKPHDKQDREKLVLKEAETNVPLPKSDLLFSYKVLYEDKDVVEIILVATSKAVVLEWQEFFKSLNIDIEFFDVEPLATFRGLSLPPQKAPVGVVDMGAVTTHVSIFDKNGLRYDYAINIAGEQLTAEIAKSLKKSLEEAEELKKEIGLSKTGDQVFAILAKVLQPVVADIKKTFNYFSEQIGESVGGVILVGGSSMLKGLADYFNANLGIPTTIGEQALVKSDVPLVYIEAIGLALRGLDEKWDASDPAILPVQETRPKSSVVKPTSKTLSEIMHFIKSSKDHVSQSDDQDADKKLRIQKIALIGLLVVAIIVIPASYWYKSYRKAQQEAEVQSRLKAIDDAVQAQENPQTKTLEETPGSVIINPTPSNASGQTGSPQAEKKVIITETPVGYLNVRKGPGVNFDKVAKVYPGESHTLLEEKENWYKIKVDESIEGWITSQYANK